MTKMLIAGFTDRDEADMAIRELEDEGYNRDDISVITNSDSRTTIKREITADDTASGTISGAATGGALGGLAGLLAGIGIVPALAGLLIGGPIAAALGLTGVAATTVSGAVTGALAGGLVGALTDLGLPEETARAYEKTVKEGGVILAVPVESDEKRSARQILSAHGATGVSEFEVKERAGKQ